MTPAERLYASAIRDPESDLPWHLLPAPYRLRLDAAVHAACLEYAADLRDQLVAVCADRDRLADPLARTVRP